MPIWPKALDDRSARTAVCRSRKLAVACGTGSEPPNHDRSGQLTRQPAEVIGVRGEHGRACRGGHDDDVRVDNVGSSRLAEQLSDLTGLLWRERRYRTTPEETSQLNLASRAAHLGDGGRRRRRDGPHLKPDAVIGPNPAIVTLGGDQHTRVVDDGHAE